jgi:hypothetical protein
MLSHIYYAIGVFILLFLIGQISMLKKIQSINEWVEKFKNVTKRNPKKNDYRSEEELNILLSVSFLSFIESIWIIFGLLTSNWYIFLFIFIYYLIINLLTRHIKFTLFGRIVILHFIIIKFLVYLYLIINHFHLHYDTLSIIKSYIDNLYGHN